MNRGALTEPLTLLRRAAALLALPLPLVGGCHPNSNAGASSDDASSDDASFDAPAYTPPPPCMAMLADGDCSIAPPYANAPELTVQSGVPRGLVVHFTMSSSSSKIFPGVCGPFMRDVWVYVPSQYVDGTAAPLLVVQDGNSYMDDTTAALDTMINAKSLPAMVAVFIGAGPDPGVTGGERSHEYDTLSTDYTQFVETEVLPLIPKNADIQAKYKNLKITTDPDGRASMGGSSGGAAAFTMGWFHPELYHRILSYSGSFTDLAPTASYPHGAYEYPEHLVAGTPAKPLRVFLEVGEKDLDLEVLYRDGMHTWSKADEEMAAALGAQGYHYSFVYALGAGHVDPGVVGQTLPEALRWLWSGYPIM